MWLLGRGEGGGESPGKTRGVVYMAAAAKGCVHTTISRSIHVQACMHVYSSHYMID